MAIGAAAALSRLTKVLATHAALTRRQRNALRSATIPAIHGKPYELSSLAHMLETLAHDEGFTYAFPSSGAVVFRPVRGPIDHSYTSIGVLRSGSHVANVWTDIQFSSLSACRNTCHAGAVPGFGEKHELDIVITEPGAGGYPCHTQIFLGVECKETVFTNALLKQVLGVRREMCYFKDLHRSRLFVSQRWGYVPAIPSSWLCVHGSDSTILRYAAPGEYFGIDFEHVP